nr:hypothetical protein CFP56_72041 [Quercus suber]
MSEEGHRDTSMTRERRSKAILSTSRTAYATQLFSLEFFASELRRGNAQRIVPKKEAEEKWGNDGYAIARTITHIKEAS